VKVRVTEVDVARKRIGLTMKLGETPVRRDAPRDNRFEGSRQTRCTASCAFSDGVGVWQAAKA